VTIEIMTGKGLVIGASRNNDDICFGRQKGHHFLPSKWVSFSVSCPVSGCQLGQLPAHLSKQDRRQRLASPLYPLPRWLEQCPPLPLTAV
jgi:hypothetical protein